MEVISTQPFDWAHDTFVALNENPTEKWASFNAQQSPFAVPPNLLTHSSVERYGQITPPEDKLSPADDVRRDSGYREGSIPVEHLHNEMPWPVERSLQPLQDFNDAHEQPSGPNTSALKRRRSSKDRATANHTAPAPHSPRDQNAAATNKAPQPKRKRGRPKAQPQTVEAFTQDGVPVQVTSARQNHLEKNRVAAHKCRQRKKVYIDSLELRARDFSSKNKILKENVALLREEVLGLKNEVLRHAGCGFWAVDEYLARCAGDLLGLDSHGQKLNTTHSPTFAPTDMSLFEQERESSMDAPLNQDMTSPEEDDYGGLELLRDFDGDDDDEIDIAD
ncbi:hypothetical protein EJ04DRAFT_306583 [Polyplosphaeria fusca]|uniref:BZIP domain-containing protein n=1 Tax=Polyplosphaeria fusca TaxID=682080 RepID=A0A9P4QW70_9PLEO|nr:hypothetical protein EJ04DRAFT_306583 [Polyplosphaeria fusca]